MGVVAIISTTVGVASVGVFTPAPPIVLPGKLSGGARVAGFVGAPRAKSLRGIEDARTLSGSMPSRRLDGGG